MRRWFLRFPVNLVAVLMFGLLTTGLGGAEPVAANGTSIVNAYYTTKCLDVPGGSKKKGVEIQLWTCNANPWQHWDFVPVPNSSWFLIENDDTGLCLSILDNSDKSNATVIQWSCDFQGNDAFESWRQSAPSGEWEFFNLGNPHMMVPNGCNGSDGTEIAMLGICTTNTAYFWR